MILLSEIKLFEEQSESFEYKLRLLEMNNSNSQLEIDLLKDNIKQLKNVDEIRKEEIAKLTKILEDIVIKHNKEKNEAKEISKRKVDDLEGQLAKLT